MYVFDVNKKDTKNNVNWCPSGVFTVPLNKFSTAISILN